MGILSSILSAIRYAQIRKMGINKDIERLKKALNDRDKENGLASANELAYVGDKGSIDLILDLCEERIKDSDVAIRCQTIDVLGVLYRKSYGRIIRAKELIINQKNDRDPEVLRVIQENLECM